ncbi:uncharacterized protein MYCFIDRAFT_180075 [Pseudocercospora fijiensis CIRAD86]|uniref:Uncharacterized protein n=1 Tax=Pseudocercospora fijiensis (strain CIRAD86) TaxID=383855 RepID=M3AJ40_PSEFD|nr:uncharacterized protein MYCFIDRAFT_180075 [Pseudocercospora fijiensis CIRAD86]EME77198.1 hypothetical protein MYCFIDRAFT_180075 [Pseudocercospora fijiensis CIRAD86]
MMAWCCSNAAGLGPNGTRCRCLHHRRPAPAAEADFAIPRSRCSWWSRRCMLEEYCPHSSGLPFALLDAPIFPPTSPIQAHGPSTALGIPVQRSLSCASVCFFMFRGASSPSQRWYGLRSDTWRVSWIAHCGRSHNSLACDAVRALDAFCHWVMGSCVIGLPIRLSVFVLAAGGLQPAWAGQRRDEWTQYSLLAKLHLVRSEDVTVRKMYQRCTEKLVLTMVLLRDKTDAKRAEKPKYEKLARARWPSLTTRSMRRKPPGHASRSHVRVLDVGEPVRSDDSALPYTDLYQIDALHPDARQANIIDMRRFFRGTYAMESSPRPPCSPLAGRRRMPPQGTGTPPICDVWMTNFLFQDHLRGPMRRPALNTRRENHMEADIKDRSAQFNPTYTTTARETPAQLVKQSVLRPHPFMKLETPSSRENVRSTLLGFPCDSFSSTEGCLLGSLLSGRSHAHSLTARQLEAVRLQDEQMKSTLQNSASSFEPSARGAPTTTSPTTLLLYLRIKLAAQLWRPGGFLKRCSDMRPQLKITSSVGSVIDVPRSTEWTKLFEFRASIEDATVRDY